MGATVWYFLTNSLKRRQAPKTAQLFLVLPQRLLITGPLRPELQSIFKHGGSRRSFTLVLPKAHNLIEHNIILRRIDINTEVSRAQCLETDKSVRRAAQVQ